jgi:hypothetical protein
MAFVVKYQLPEQMARILCPRARPFFKVKPDVVIDNEFEARLKVGLADWKLVRDLGLDLLVWWERLVKPGIRRLALERGRELSKERRGALCLLQVRQAYLQDAGRRHAQAPRAEGGQHEDRSLVPGGKIQDRHPGPDQGYRDF